MPDFVTRGERHQTGLIAHRSRNHAQRGQTVMAAPDISTIDELQPMLYRLGMNVGDENAACINRVAVVKQVAAVIVKARGQLV